MSSIPDAPVHAETLDRPLGECLRLVIDHRGKTPKKLGGDWVAHGIPAISAKNVNGGRLVATEDIRYVTDEVYRRWMKEDVQRGDCLLVSEGATLGECMLWDEDYPIVLSQRIFCLRPNTDVLYPRYLYAYMTTSEFQAEVKGRATGSSVDGLRQTEVLKLNIALPPLAQQREIGDVLYSLNKKIELNRRMNGTLEAMAQALFKEWFVDGAKEEWEEATLREACDIHDSKRVPLSNREREQRPGLYPYYGAASVMDHVNDFLFDGIHVLMGEDGSVVNPDGTPVLQYVWGKIWVNNHAHVLTGKDRISTEHLLLALREVQITPYVTGAVQMKLNQGNLFKVPFLLPPVEVCTRFNEIIAPLYAKLRANIEESRTLTALRDALLPKLMRGEVRVKAPQATSTSILRS